MSLGGDDLVHDLVAPHGAERHEQDDSLTVRDALRNLLEVIPLDIVVPPAGVPLPLETLLQIHGQSALNFRVAQEEEGLLDDFHHCPPSLVLAGGFPKAMLMASQFSLMTWSG